MKVWTLEVPWAPPSLNRQLRMHWAGRKRLRVLAERELSFIRPHAGSGAGLRRRLRLTRRGPRLLDLDNLAGAYKPVVDAAVRLGLLSDDSPQSGNVIEYAQEKAREPSTLVYLEDLTG